MPKNLMHDYNPRLRIMIKAAILDVLYGPINKHFKKRFDDLIDANSTLQPASPRSFRHAGTTYTHSQATPPSNPYANNRLADDLKPRLDEILREQKELADHERPYVENYINKVLTSSDNLPDYITLLPDLLRAPVQTLIDTCPCRNCSLSVDEIKEIKDKNAESRLLMGQRLAQNLINP